MRVDDLTIKLSDLFAGETEVQWTVKTLHDEYIRRKEVIAREYNNLIDQLDEWLSEQVKSIGDQS